MTGVTTFAHQLQSKASIFVISYCVRRPYRKIFGLSFTPTVCLGVGKNTAVPGSY